MDPELQKLKNGEPFDSGCEALDIMRDRCNDLCDKLNLIPVRDESRLHIIKDIFGSVGTSPLILTNFHVEVGKNTFLGNNFFCNFNCVMIDLYEIHIGNNVQLGPNVSLITVNHPLNVEDRRKGLATGGNIHIEDDVWIGTGSIILPNVTIGKGAVVAAGSVVNKDVPPYKVVAGVPAKVIKDTDDVNV